MGQELAYDWVFDAQGNFRLLLDAMSRPGKIMPPPELKIQTPDTFPSASAMVAFALLNAETSFCCLSDHDSWNESYIKENTSAKSVDIACADFVFLNGDQPAGGIAVKTGSLIYPEEGATLVIAVEEISIWPLLNSVGLRLKGPGIKSENTLFVKGLSRNLLVEIIDKNAEFPLGVDAILCDSFGHVASLPRSCRISFD